MKDTATSPDGQEKQSAGAIALAFLERLDPHGVHALSAIPVEGGPPVSRTFLPAERGHIPEWVNARNGRMNLYYSVNEPRADLGPHRAKKSDIVALRALHVDVDPPAGLELDAARADILARFQNYPVPFSEIVDSGGGYQGLVLLSGKMPLTPDALEWAEGCNRALRDALGGDNAQDVNRILRLPGTENMPGEDKRKKGRIQRTASTAKAGGEGFTPEALAQRIAPVATIADRAGGNEADVWAAVRAVELSGFYDVDRYDELPADLRARFEHDLERYPGLGDLYRDGMVRGTDTSGSAQRLKLAGALKGIEGYSVEEYAALAWTWELPDVQRFGRDEAARQLGRDWAHAGAWTPGTVLDPAEWFEVVEPSIFEDAAPAAETTRTVPRKLALLSFDAAADMALEATTEPLIEDLLDQGASSVVYGASNTGKTFVVLDMSFAIATGRRWDGRETTQSGVLYLALEGGAGIRARFAALRKTYPDADTSRMLLASDGLDLCNGKDDVAAVVEAARSIPGGCGLIVVDTLARAMAGGDENSAADMGKLIRNVDMIRAATGAHVLLIHHSGKDEARGARGSSALRAAVDTELQIADSKILNPKQRDHEQQPPRDFRLRPVPLGTSPKGRPVVSAVVQIGAPEIQPAASLTPTETKTLAAFRELAAKHQRVTAKMLAKAKGTTDDAARKQVEALAKKGYVRKEAGHGTGFSLAAVAHFDPAPVHDVDATDLAPGAENVCQFPARQARRDPQKTGKSGNSTSPATPAVRVRDARISGMPNGIDIFG
jgi:hypothetical protein